MKQIKMGRKLRMNILAVDDERVILDSMLSELERVFLHEDIHGEKSGKAALDYIKEKYEQNNPVKYAFLDIQLRDINGIELGKMIKEINPETKIIFCTAYSEYAYESYRLNAIGYLLKPIMAEDIIRTLKAMDRDWKTIEDGAKQKIYVQTFGIFEVYVNDEPVIFEREKAREILAYLVTQRGENVTVSELAEIIYEDKTYDRKTMNQIYAILSSLKKSLKNAGIEGIYKKSFKYISVDMSQLTCDFIELENGNVAAMNAYKGNYLENYSWGEFTNGLIASKTEDYN